MQALARVGMSEHALKRGSELSGGQQQRAAIARTLLPVLLEALISSGCEVRGDEAVCASDNRVIAAGEVDWSTEYLDAVALMLQKLNETEIRSKRSSAATV